MRSLLLTICLAAPLVVRAETLRAEDSTAAARPDTAVYLMPRVDVVGKRENLKNIAGSANVLDSRTLEISRVFTTNEALRQLPGLVVRDEEGFGMRPNIGIRGLNPTRSTKATLLEDGVPLSYAPYGDNASYYHPPIERFDHVELLKGAGQIQFGPQTIGGVINYVTPAPPVGVGGSVSVVGGSRDYSGGRVRLGARRMLLDYTQKEGRGARDNIDSRMHDLSFKTVVGSSRSLTLRANYFKESSTVTYSGLTQAEFDRLGPRYNAFENDDFQTQRFGASGTHNLVVGRSTLVTTNLYVAYFDRDWWRQSSTTTDTQGGPGVLSHRLAGDPIDPDTIQSIQGRLREYTTWGLEPRVKHSFSLMGMASELQAGVKAHFEIQDRKQRNGTSPNARTGSLVEDNLRTTRAYSAFLVDRIQSDGWSLTPGLRYEQIHSRRENRLPGGLEGTDHLGKWIPSLGAAWNPSSAVTVFAGVHQGFAPPRTEDIISSAGTSTDVGPEESTNWELGARLSPAAAGEVQAVLFRNDFQRLIAVGSIAGGSTPLAEGEARFAGAELSGRYRHASGAYLRAAYTWVPEAEQITEFRQVVNGAVIAGSAAGKRQPYAPEHMLAAAVGYAWRKLDAQLEAVHVGRQFGDFANTVSPTADGQRGELAASTIWNATVNQELGSTGAIAFVSVKNLADEVYIVDRTRGIQVGSPRLVQAGFKYTFAGGQ